MDGRPSTLNRRGNLYFKIKEQFSFITPLNLSRKSLAKPVYSITGITNRHFLDKPKQNNQTSNIKKAIAKEDRYKILLENTIS